MYDAEGFADFIKPVNQRWYEFDFNQWTHGDEDSCWEIALNGNWKFAEENYVDGYSLLDRRIPRLWNLKIQWA